MEFDYYVTKKTLAEKYNIKLSTEELPTFRVDREVFYRISEVSKYLNDKTGKNIIWK